MAQSLLIEDRLVRYFPVTGICSQAANSMYALPTHAYSSAPPSSRDIVDNAVETIVLRGQTDVSCLVLVALSQRTDQALPETR